MIWKHHVREIELQLSGLKFTKDVKTTLGLSDVMPPAQRRLVETVMILPGTTLEEEFHRRDAAIDAVVVYCRFEESGQPRVCQANETHSEMTSGNPRYFLATEVTGNHEA